MKVSHNHETQNHNYEMVSYTYEMQSHAMLIMTKHDFR